MFKITFDEVMSRAKTIHGNKYVYREDTYRGVAKPMAITCKLHGMFKQRPHDHCSGQQCPVCAQATRNSKHTDSLTTFITKAVSVHKNLYNYDFVVYSKSSKKVDIVCKIHGIFKQTPNKHLMGQGCPICNKPQQKTTKSFIAEAVKVHGKSYNYEEVVYIDIDTKIIITCPTHGKFEQTAYSHLKGGQCPQCANYGFKQNIPATLYYLKLTYFGNIYYKIGVTNRTVNERFSKSELQHIQVLRTILFNTGKEAYAEEQMLLKKYAYLKYDGPALLHNGNTEILIGAIPELE